MAEQKKILNNKSEIDTNLLIKELTNAIRDSIQAQNETNSLISQLNNNNITLSNNQRLSGDSNHIQLLTEFRSLSQALTVPCKTVTVETETDWETNVLHLLNDIIAEQKASADVGETRYISATASTTEKVYDFVLNREPYHKIKRVLIKNDGATTIQVANDSPDTAHFIDIYADEYYPLEYNRDVISKIIIKSVSGSPAYRMWYSW